MDSRVFSLLAVFSDLQRSHWSGSLSHSPKEPISEDRLQRQEPLCSTNSWRSAQANLNGRFCNFPVLPFRDLIVGIIEKIIEDLNDEQVVTWIGGKMSAFASRGAYWQLFRPSSASPVHLQYFDLLILRHLQAMHSKIQNVLMDSPVNFAVVANVL